MDSCRVLAGPPTERVALFAFFTGTAEPERFRRNDRFGSQS